MSIALRPAELRSSRFRRGLVQVATRIRGAVGEVYALAREPEPRVRGRESALQAEVVEARLLASTWQARAERAEARTATLEAELVEATRMALELRSRVVCLQGKLVTTNATARYQSLTLALESRSERPGAQND